MAWLFKILISIAIIGIGLYFNADRLDNPLIWVIAVFFWGAWLKIIWESNSSNK